MLYADSKSFTLSSTPRSQGSDHRINEKIKEAVVLDSHTKRSCGGVCGTGLDS